MNVWIAVIAFFTILIPILLPLSKKTRRISRTQDLPDDYAGVWLSGIVTSVPDGDGFRFFHCPWFRSSIYTSEDSTLYVRLAGIDAPEMGNPGMPEQPFAREAKEYHKRLVEGKNVKIKVVGKDQSGRVLAFAFLHRSSPTFLSDIFPPMDDSVYINVNLEMVKNGYACVYTGRDAKYDEYGEELMNAEKKAKYEKKGFFHSTMRFGTMCHQHNKEEQKIAVWTAVCIFVLLILILILLYIKTRKISRTQDLPDHCAGVWLSGIVTGVSDGDGFRFIHIPWLRSPVYTSEDSRLKVRLAGIDAPEMGNRYMPGQPFAREAKEYHKRLVEGKNVKIKVVGKDRFKRVLAFAFLPRSPLTFLLGIFFLVDSVYINVNLEMVENGYACVYTGRDAKYDEYGEELLNAEEKAKYEKKGIWNIPNFQIPMEHKRFFRK